MVSVMRILLCLVVAMLVSSAVAADWGHYVNERFGVESDVPPGFVAGAPPANGDGLGFSTPTAHLAVFGSLLAGDFEAGVRQRVQWRGDDGWAVTYQAITPSWASYSGTKGGRVFYARAISMCGGGVIGMFELDYSSADLAAFDPIVDRLVHSLKDSGAGWQC